MRTVVESCSWSAPAESLEVARGGELGRHFLSWGEGFAGGAGSGGEEARREFLGRVLGQRGSVRETTTTSEAAPGFERRRRAMKPRSSSVDVDITSAWGGAPAFEEQEEEEEITASMVVEKEKVVKSVLRSCALAGRSWN